MGRHSSFNRQQVLADALSLFWSRGFSATSLKQLEEVTEMHPGSLYYHFRNKEQLYLAVLEYYLQWHLQPRIHKHLVYGSGLTGLRRFFTSGYRHNQELAFQNCCFLVSTSTELHLLPTEASSMVKTGIQQLREGFLEHLKKTTQQEKALDTEDLEKTVSELTNLYLSLQLMARVDPNQRRLDKQVNNCLKNLSDHHKKSDKKDDQRTVYC